MYVRAIWNEILCLMYEEYGKLRSLCLNRAWSNFRTIRIIIILIIFYDTSEHNTNASHSNKMWSAIQINCSRLHYYHGLMFIWYKTKQKNKKPNKIVRWIKLNHFSRQSTVECSIFRNVFAYNWYLFLVNRTFELVSI